MLDLLFGPKRRADFVGSGFSSLWGGGLGGPVRTQANVEVSEQTALTYAAAWRCSQILSSAVAGLPLVTYYHLPGGNKEEARDHPLYEILKDIPNPDMDSMAWREGRTLHQLNWGSGFSEIARNRKGDVEALWPIHPARVRPVRREERDQNGNPLLPTYRYRVRNNDGSEVVLRADEMLHIPGSHSEDGIWGKSIIAHARESIGMGLATERHGATFFGSGAQPPAVLFLPGMKDPEARKQFRSEWVQVHGSPDAHNVAILPPEGKYEKLAYSPEDSQFLMTRVQNCREVCRWYGVPPSLVGDLEKTSYNSLEQDSLNFIAFSLIQWIRRWEGQIKLKLYRPEERQRLFTQHDIEALVHGDMASRYAAYSVGLTKGFLSINDVRRMLNKNSIGPLGDKYRVELNTAPLDTLQMAGLPAPGKTVATGGEIEKGGKPATTPPPGQMPDKLLDVPAVRQITGYDCGAASCRAVALFWGVDDGKTEEEFIADLGTKQVEPMNEDGTHTASIIKYFTEKGLTVTAGEGWTLDDLRHFWAAGQPVIVPIQDYGTPPEFAEYRENQSGHYVVVKGLGFSRVACMDPSADNAEAGGRLPDSLPDTDAAPGEAWILEETFMDCWHDMDDENKVLVQYGIAVGRGHAPPPPATSPATAPAKPDVDEPEPTPGPADSDSRDRGTKTTEAKAAARAALAGVLSRMFAKEANAVRRFADKADFEERLADHQVKKQGAALKAAVFPIVQALALAGFEKPENWELSIAMNSESLLKEAYDTDTKPQFAARLDGWAAERTRQVVDAVLPIESEPAPLTLQAESGTH
jgi:HK97 family phage portal protein